MSADEADVVKIGEAARAQWDVLRDVAIMHDENMAAVGAPAAYLMSGESAKQLLAEHGLLLATLRQLASGDTTPKVEVTAVLRAQTLLKIYQAH